LNEAPASPTVGSSCSCVSTMQDIPEPQRAYRRPHHQYQCPKGSRGNQKPAAALDD
jgi:hypothetical protein